MSFWESMEGYLDKAVDTAAEVYVKKNTPRETTQALPEQTVTTVPAQASDRGAIQPDRLGRTVNALAPFQPYLPFAAIALVLLLLFVRGR